ncbi:MAG: ComF family protein [Steroidobacteraceae bacterium]
MVYAKQIRGLLATAVRRWVLPSRCIACGLPGDDWDLCGACQAQLPVNVHACTRCGLPLSDTQSELICGSCLKRPPAYQAAYCAYKYAYPIEHLIRKMKYAGALAHARVLGDLLACHLRTQHCGAWPDCLIPVPLHRTRFQQRGYNQVVELGRFLAQSLEIEMRTDLVERIRHTPEQAGLSRKVRRKNLRRAFAATNVALPKHVALLDDVVTTGSTVNELAITLRKAGIESIEVWSLARVARKGSR